MDTIDFRKACYVLSEEEFQNSFFKEETVYGESPCQWANYLTEVSIRKEKGFLSYDEVRNLNNGRIYHQNFSPVFTYDREDK